MAESSFPFTGSDLATESQWSKFIRAIGGLDGVHADDQAGTELKVTANSTANVTVEAGEAIVNGFFYMNTAQLTKAVPSNAGGGSARIDRVVLRASQTLNSVVCQYVTGGTSAPTLQKDRNDVWELELAQITVAAGATTVPAGNVVDHRTWRGKGVTPSNSSYRRPPIKGQVIVEGTATAPVVLVGSGTAWNQIYPEPVPVWTAPALTSPWANTGGSNQTVRYTKYSGIVFLQGMVQPSSATGDNSTIFTLPSGFRPSANLEFVAAANDSNDIGTSLSNGEVLITSAGVVQAKSDHDAGDYICLTGISFPLG